ncbi:hypothetical protein [Luteolibacter marinus]|uniref:hypothetical protein n=1 Tax=Luteolibacter marinus TaxID=2776705 RepID=UPI0018686B65|nr:hypothetical protein [Luteolibacter marinus]
MAKKATDQDPGAAGLSKPDESGAPTVTVRVTGQPVGEDGAHYAKGETFQTTAERAAALGAYVEIVED